VTAVADSPALQTYPRPDACPASTRYALRVDDQPVGLYHTVEGVTIEGLYFDGRRVTDIAELELHTAFASGIRLV
jgi:hypothetical protein